MGKVLILDAKKQLLQSLIGKSALISIDHPFQLRLERMIADLHVDIERQNSRRSKHRGELNNVHSMFR